MDQKSEAILVPIYGVLTPFHILTLKNATVNQVRLILGQRSWCLHTASARGGKKLCKHCCLSTACANVKRTVSLHLSEPRQVR